MDEIDGDPEDQQSDGDDKDGNAAEDDFMDFGLSQTAYGAGCPIADPAEDGDPAEADDFREPEDYADGGSGSDGTTWPWNRP